MALPEISASSHVGRAEPFVSGNTNGSAKGPNSSLQVDEPVHEIIFSEGVPDQNGVGVSAPGKNEIIDQIVTDGTASQEAVKKEGIDGVVASLDKAPNGPFYDSDEENQFNILGKAPLVPPPPNNHGVLERQLGLPPPPISAHHVHPPPAPPLNNTQLYQRYVQALESRDPPKSKKPNKAPLLVTGLIDYVRTLEERLEKIESNQLSRQKAWQEFSHGPGPGQGVSDGQIPNPAPVSPPSEGILRTQFFERLHQPCIDPRIFEDVRWKGPGTFNSETDPHPLLRVLYQWNREQTNLTGIGSPEADDIELLEIRLHSEPVLNFLEAKVGYEVGNNGLVRMTRPFRFLTRNASAIRKHLDILENTTDARDDSDSTQGSDSVDQRINSESSEDIHSSSSMDARNRVQDEADEPVTDSHDTEEALCHFRELMNFIDNYLGKELAIYEELRSGRASTVSFDNLWMLFDCNDTIFSASKKGDLKIPEAPPLIGKPQYSLPSETSQAWRVLGTLGGTMNCDGGVPSNPYFTGVTKMWWRSENDQDSESDLQQDGEKARDIYAPLWISCYSIYYDGFGFKPLWDFFVLKPFEGQMEITALDVYPLIYHTQKTSQNPNNLDLTQRGLDYIEYTSARHRNYEGMTLGEHREEISSPVMIDLKYAYREHPDLVPKVLDHSAFWKQRPPPGCVIEIGQPCDMLKCTKPFCLLDKMSAYQHFQCDQQFPKISAILEEYDNIDHRRMADLKTILEKNNLLVLLPGKVYGYALRLRKWALLNISLLQKVSTDNRDSGWDDLVLPKDHKRLVRSLVETHSKESRLRSASAGKDGFGLVQGKGKGCIILLHGVPGVGKTSTAECVAAYTQSPLLPVTCGDIGYEPLEVEQNLEALFKRAHEWGCVLLIDEADVFLAERDKSDIKRNGLVSIFLRILEYYSGILFLTTNRVGAFDDAFRSRIHLNLYYPRLDKKQSKKVWEMNMKRIGNLNVQRADSNFPAIQLNQDEIVEFAESNYKTLLWNGRQIHNAFQTALALAQFKVRDTPDVSPQITVKHFKTIAKASIQFDDYLKDVHMGDEAKNAKMRRLRDDDSNLYKRVRKLKTPRSHKSRRDSSDESSSSSSSSESKSSSEGSDSDSDASKKKAKGKGKKKVKGEVKDKEKERKKAKKKGRRDDEDEDESESEEKEKKSKAKKKKSKLQDSDDDGSD